MTLVSISILLFLTFLLYVLIHDFCPCVAPNISILLYAVLSLFNLAASFVGWELTTHCTGNNYSVVITSRTDGSIFGMSNVLFSTRNNVGRENSQATASTGLRPAACVKYK
jgi:hypothetical protein